MLSLKSWIMRLFLVLITFTLVTACQNSVNSPSLLNQHLASLQEPVDCRMVAHELGETRVCGTPQRVVALSPHILDSILALDVQPIAYAEATALTLETFDRPHEQIPYLGDRVTTKPVNLGSRQSPSLEKLLLLKPDLILGESWNNEDVYPLLSQIAPTLLFSDIKDDRQSWKNDIEGIAKALNQEHQVKELLADQQRAIATTQEKLASILATHPNVLILSADSTLKNIAIHEDSTAGTLLKELGFKLIYPQSISDQSAGYLPISIEVVPTLEADIAIVMAWDSGNLYRPQEQLKSLWNNTPILKAHATSNVDQVHVVDYQLWGSVTRGPITDQLILQALPELLLSPT
jgi:iron complex transport system substrate-binding protein